MRGVRLRTGVIWTMGGNLVQTAAHWGMLVVLARLGNPETVGLLALGYAVSAPVFLLSGLGLRQGLATDATREHAFRDYMRLRMLTWPLSLVMLVLVCLVVGYGGYTMLVIVSVGAIKSAESVAEIYHGALQRMEYFGRLAVLLSLRSSASLVALAGTFVVVQDLLVSLVAVILTNLFVLAADHGATHSIESPARHQPSLEGIKHLVSTSWPLGLTAMLVSLTTMSPRYFVEKVLGPADLGVFSALAYALVAGGTLVMALAQSVAPRLAVHYAAGRPHDATALLLRAVAMAGAVGITGLGLAGIWGSELLGLVYGEFYASYERTLIILTLGFLASALGVVLRFGAFAARVFRPLPWIHAGAVCVTVGACIMLVDDYGVDGAAIAYGVGQASQLTALGILNFWALRRLNLATALE